jgi:acetylornithine/succinyldiaminopimelate/putrescine aminotransferase
LIDAARDSGEYFLGCLQELAGRRPQLGRPRGRGLMLAFELLKDSDSGEPYAEMLNPFVLACKTKGVHVTYTYYEGAIRLIPASTISRSEIDFAIDVFDKVLADVEHGRIRPNDHEQQNQVMQRVSARRRPMRRMLRRLWETSPQYWLDRLKNRI